MSVPYTHALNQHSLEGAVHALKYLLQNRVVKSLLDVGAGTGTWLRAAQLAGIQDVQGVDGAPTENREILVERELIGLADLTKPLLLGRRFDVVICLEVAEHLPPESAPTLIDSLCQHSALILFSAAAPFQHGEHHVNCQWPAYWQRLFNQRSFACYDSIRPMMWEDANVEPWYRQNSFIAERNEAAGSEPRILSQIHPDMLPHMSFPNTPAADYVRRVEAGMFGPQYYIKRFGRSVMRLMTSGE